MNLLPQNHQDKNNFSPDLWRFIYIGPRRRPDVHTMTQDVTIDRPPIVETEQKLNQHVDKAKKKVLKYNEKYAKRPWLRETFNCDRRPFEKAINIVDFDNPQVTIAHIDALLDTPYKFDGRMRKLRTHIPSRERRSQKHDLLKIRKMFVDYIAMKNVERGERSYFLVRKSKRIMEMVDQKKGVERKKPYQDLSKDYDQVFGILSGRDKDFKRFYEKPDGTIDPSKARESKQLFFSILNHETNGFKTDFVLGKFNNNPDDNKKNYPFIYHKWLKIQKFDLRKKEAAYKLAQDKAKDLGLAKPDDSIGAVTGILNNINRTVTAPGAGLQPFSNPLTALTSLRGPARRSAKGRSYYTRVEEAFKTIWKDIGYRIDAIDNDPRPKMKKLVESLRKSRKIIYKYYELAKAQYDWAAYKAQAKDIDTKFTLKELRKPKNKQIVLELAMLKFAKAMEHVESPSVNKQTNAGDLHGRRVKRMLIATMYYEGVGRYDDTTGKYVDNVSREYKWALSKLAQSKYFNPTEGNNYLTPEQRGFLYIVRYANLALSNVNYLKNDVVKNLKAITVRLQAANLPVAAGSPKLAQVNADIAVIQRHTGTRINQTNAISQAQGIITNKESEIIVLKKFYKKAEAIMANPDRNKMRAFLEEIKTSGSSVLNSPGNKKKLENFTKYLQSVDLNYNMFDFKEKSTGDYLERMGIKPDAIYEAYKKYTNPDSKNPHSDMTVDQWDHHMRDAKGTQKLLDMFGKILHEGKNFTGKKEFIGILSTLHGFKPLATKPKTSEAQAVAISIYTTLKLEIRKRENMPSKGSAKYKEAMEALDGMTFGDRVTEYVGGVKDMLLGPGQSLANRAAGFAILFALYKVANHAIRGNKGKGRTLLRLLFMAGAAEIALKQLTGEGLTDKFKLTGLAKKLGGTYEDVLLDRAKDKFDNTKYAGESITDTDHSKALLELRRSNVPFSKIVDWYKSTKPDGSPRSSKEKVRLPIDYSAIVSGSVDKNSEDRGRFILKKTIENFFEYVANKDRQAGNKASTGMNILEEVWVKPVNNKDFSMKSTKYADRQLSSFFLTKLRNNPRSVTWTMVMESEIRLKDVEDTKKRKATQRAKDYVIGSYTSLSRWSRRHIEQRAGAGAEGFWKNVDTRYAPAIKNFLVSMGESGATKLRYGTRHVELWYKGKKYELRKFAREHWEVVVESTRFVFDVMYAGDQWLIPRVSKWARQTREIIRPDKIVTIPHTRDLQIDDIMNKTTFDKFHGKAKTATTPMVRPEHPHYDIFDKKINPKAEYFGIYTFPFYRAMEQKNLGRQAYYESKNQSASHLNFLEGNPNIGYYISEVSEAKTPGLKPTNSRKERTWAMDAASREQAKQVFLSKGVPPGRRIEYAKDIDRYMRPVHVITKTAGPNNRPPAKVYTFWRMPLYHSEEYRLIKEGRLPDFIDANRRKMSPPFKIDPTKGVIDNLIAAYGITSPFLRKGGRTISIAAAQWLHVALGIVRTAGDVAQWGLHWPEVDAKLQKIGFPPGLLSMNPETRNFIEDLSKLGTNEKHLQWIDEYLGSASFAPLSQLYKVPKNSNNYKQAVEISMKSGEKINLKRNEKTGNDWDWEEILIDTGRVDDKGQKIYLGGIDPVTKKPIPQGRLNLHLYPGKRP